MNRVSLADSAVTLSGVMHQAAPGATHLPLTSALQLSLDVVRIECLRCGRAGSYRRDGLLAQFGPDAALPPP